MERLPLQLRIAVAHGDTEETEPGADGETHVRDVVDGVDGGE